MCAVTVYVNDRLHHHYGRSAKRNPAVQAFIAVYLLRERALGIDTIVKAAVATGTTRAAFHAALIVQQNGDEDLAASVLKGREPLSCAASEVRGRVKLIEFFKSATPDDRVAFSRALGPTDLFEAAIEPALSAQPDPRARSAPGAQDRSNEGAAKGKATTMNMREFAGSRFITVDDLRDGPREEVIISVAPGNYDRPVATFESGDKRSLNVTNVNTLIKAYGPNDKDWIGCVVELHIGLLKFNDEPRDGVIVKPISAPKPVRARTPVPKRPSKKPDLDDDIPF